MVANNDLQRTLKSNGMIFAKVFDYSNFLNLMLQSTFHNIVAHIKS